LRLSSWTCLFQRMAVSGDCLGTAIMASLQANA
jgi:hypothetical protein